MTPLKIEIERLQEKITRKKEQLNESYGALKQYWNDTYHNSFKDRCEMIYLYTQGKIYKPYNFSNNFKLEREQEWKKKNYYDYCNIYEGFGSPIGFISLESGLFEATKGKHKLMWLSAIKDLKEERSFEQFSEQLKTDSKFLCECFENAIKEKGSGVYSTDNYLLEIEEKRLKTEKYYIYLENTSRRL